MNENMISHPAEALWHELAWLGKVI